MMFGKASTPPHIVAFCLLRGWDGWWRVSNEQSSAIRAASPSFCFVSFLLWVAWRKMIKPIKGGIIEFPRLSRCLGSTFSIVECGSGRSCDKTFGSKDSKPNLNFWTWISKFEIEFQNIQNLIWILGRGDAPNTGMKIRLWTLMWKENNQIMETDLNF